MVGGRGCGHEEGAGHSLGGGIALLLALHLQGVLPDVRCLAYATPACMTASLCDAATATGTVSLINSDDIVPRASVSNISRLVERLATIPEWQGAAEADMRHMLQCYVVELGTPRVRPNPQPAYHQLVRVELIVDSTSQTVQVSLKLHLPRSVEVASPPLLALPPPHAELTSGNALEVLPRGCSGLDSDHAEVGTSDKDACEESETSQGDDTAADLIHPVECVACKLVLRKKQEDGQGPVEVKIRVYEKQPTLYVPGTIVYMFRWRGTYRSSVVPRDCPSLSRIELQAGLVEEHQGTAYHEALQETLLGYRISQSPPAWIPYNKVDICMHCHNDFGWNASLATEHTLQKMRLRNNCHQCGNVVCEACSANCKTLPEMGISAKPVRVCDSCYWGWGHQDTKASRNEPEHPHIKATNATHC